ncbi:acyl-CoA N-acyltransferase [Metschnikowia bicuspidata var. bicuspidata NRRL YB-4993]|uniref:Acyl-CoA N-acyltransferase n=1 Tax=Metschnikowia bicuspidata var. bicuspidata NRRL YB-4993 TaxID=869754 RepID=A0A1A0HKE7_9ASCO|nr:acyl-CoA N-acyltransferase [Metschnikowia bicuspidata var. bicuspidata NRRL YB-4993]OBA24495.1 acyl-CoA N-acyltransferase [Metschnikowia bicuspidata var. bicuspidata NRRL YB-4993]
MTSIKPFKMEDLYELNSVNLDPFTENFNLLFYLQYLCDWPTLFFKSVEDTGNAKREISGYMMGKTEGQLVMKEWHTHITAVTIGRNFRRIKLASDLCTHLEQITAIAPHEALFVDLFVKVTNTVARQLYEKLGYLVYRRVIGYYGDKYPTDRDHVNDDVDAFDMRKALPRDVKRETVRENGEKFNVFPHEVTF